jgi:hypothetical protein
MESPVEQIILDESVSPDIIRSWNMTPILHTLAFDRGCRSIISEEIADYPDSFEIIMIVDVKAMDIVSSSLISVEGQSVGHASVEELVVAKAVDHGNAPEQPVKSFIGVSDMAFKDIASYQNKIYGSEVELLQPLTLDDVGMAVHPKVQIG